MPNEPQAIRRLVRRLARDAAGPVLCCYEAGPCGNALQRQVATARVRCQVIAPALIPRKPGDRVKTNPRDARKLAELLRAGLLTEVRPPTPEDEAVRGLCRARDDAREDLQRCRHRLDKLLLRRGLHYAVGNWTRAHRPWVDGLAWAQPAERVVVDDYLLAIDQLEARLGRVWCASCSMSNLTVQSRRGRIEAPVSVASGPWLRTVFRSDLGQDASIEQLETLSGQERRAARCDQGSLFSVH